MSFSPKLNFYANPNRCSCIRSSDLRLMCVELGSILIGLGHVLPWPCPTLAMSYLGHALPWPCPTLAMSYLVHALPWPCPTLAMTYLGHVLPCPYS